MDLRSTQSTWPQGAPTDAAAPAPAARRNRWSGTAMALAYSLAALPAVAEVPDIGDLADLSLEQLGDIEVISVNRRAERLVHAPASVFVITREDVRRSGANSIPEALRLAPTLQVARIRASEYAISARGFNTTTTNKLLVLIDGRTVYTPLYSGVFWDAQDVLLEDIERIEVLSGPGGTLWGSNAVNGVINIVTRAASATQGLLVASAVGTHEDKAALRIGGTLPGNGAYRLYAKYLDRDSSILANGRKTFDAAQNAQVGFRTDWSNGTDDYTVQGDAYSGVADHPVTRDRRIEGANLLARWHRRSDTGAQARLQCYVDRTERLIPGTFAETLDTVDIEFQHALAPNGRHQWSWGAGHRYSRDDVTNSAGLAFIPGEKSLRWTNVFVQDDLALGERMTLSLGAKWERNVYTGTEFLPSMRARWKVADARTLWAAVSRAVRAPSRIDRDFFLPGQPPFVLAGGPEFQSETADVAELGYKAEASQLLSYSLTAFHHRYDDLRSFEPVAPGRYVFGNRQEGTSYGLEGWLRWQPLPRWTLGAGFVELRKDLRQKPGSGDPTGTRSNGNDPEHQWKLRSTIALSPSQDLDLHLHHVGRLPDPSVPSVTALDLRWEWRVHDALAVSLTVQNLTDAQHREFGALATGSFFERSALLNLEWRP
ncbi:TonB-dependent receptor plug domain-containing protein [Tahibacter amnicola]|uniref:TonB-dependent receptor n=1 Tax=Tahibacter amnicola TaxID=2976241 RepID=A0ABY6BQK4_9GAMM|nr:TonB-dependent receptor [Tahibacter amnicola]UXI70047.1 TonB-dependent receptor [Tahibacter amnicola]